jgi:hypothetical protein
MRNVTAVLAIVAVAGCGEAIAPISQLPAAIVAVTPTEVALPLWTEEYIVVQVVDEGGRGVPGITVTATPSDGTTRLTEPYTARDGIVVIVWTPRSVGEYTVTVSYGPLEPLVIHGEVLEPCLPLDHAATSPHRHGLGGASSERPASSTRSR